MASISPYSTANGRRYRVRYRTPDRRQTDKKGFKTKREAEAFAASVEVSKLNGDYIEPSRSRSTVRELGDKWLHGKGNLRPSTRLALESAWSVHVEPRWGGVPLSSIQHSEIKVWVSELAAEGKSPTTVKRAFGVLSGILEDAVLDRRISRNPCTGVKTPRKEAKERVYLEHADLHALAREAGERRLFVLVLGYTGLRWGEAVGLRVRDFNPLRGRLEVNRNAVSVKSEIVIGPTKTHERRVIPVPTFLMEDLIEHAAGRTPDEPLFPGPDGDIMRRTRSDSRSGGWFAGAVRRAGLPHLTPHDLRHTAASLAIASGANVKVVQKMLGHKSAAMTLDTYSGLFPDDLDTIATALDTAARLAVPQLLRSADH